MMKGLCHRNILSVFCWVHSTKLMKISLRNLSKDDKMALRCIGDVTFLMKCRHHSLHFLIAVATT